MSVPQAHTHMHAHMLMKCMAFRRPPRNEQSSSRVLSVVFVPSLKEVQGQLKLLGES